MLAVVIVLAVAVAALAVVAIVLGRGKASADARVSALEAELGEVRTTAEAAQAEAATRTAERDAAQARADAAEGRAARHRADAEAARAEAATERTAAATARTRASAADAVAAEASEAAATARAAADEATVEAVAARAAAEAADDALARLRRALDPPGLWAFERERLCRIWHDWVSVTLDADCPLAVDPGAAVTDAVAILADASREECGVPIDVSWSIDEATRRAMGLASVLVLLRAVEELVAAARGSDGAALSIGPAGADELELVLTPDAARPMPPGLASSAADVGWDLVERDGALVLRIPT